MIFTDINIKQSELYDLLQSFNELTQMNIVILDEDFNCIIQYPEKPKGICKYGYIDGDFRNKCVACNEYAFKQCKENKKLFIYTCHAGLMDGIAPIIDNNYIIGYMMIGQVANKNNKSKIIETVKSFISDDSEAKQIYKELVFKSAQQIKAASKILESCACYLWLNNIISVKKSTLPYKITEYIKKNISKELNLKDLCAEFNISRSTLYSVSTENFSMGITEYIRKLRILKAQTLLKNKELSVSEIAETVGISDYNYFTKIFKRITGLTPSNYRKSL